MPFEIEQIAEVVGGADGRSDSPVRGVEPDEVGVVGIRVVRSEVSGDIGGRWPDEHRVEAFAVVVVLFEPDIVPQSEAAAERLLRSRRRLGGMMQGIESGPVGIGNRPQRTRCPTRIPAYS